MTARARTLAASASSLLLCPARRHPRSPRLQETRMPSHTDAAETHGSGGRLTDGEGNLESPRSWRAWAGIAAPGAHRAAVVWPFHSVPTGSRGVITQFGADHRHRARGPGGLPPWQKLALFSIRAETANIENAEGGHLRHPAGEGEPDGALQHPDRPRRRGLREVQPRRRPVSYVQTATQEVFKAVTAKYTAPDLIAQRARSRPTSSRRCATKLATTARRSSTSTCAASPSERTCRRSTRR